MLRTLKLLFALLTRALRSRHNLLLENLSLRQQLAVLKQRKSPAEIRHHGPIVLGDTAAALAWMEAGVDTCPAGNRYSLARAGFKLYWTWLSRHRKSCGKKVR